LLIKGQGSAANLKRLYSPPAGPSFAPAPGDRMYYDENGLPVLARVGETWQTQWMNMNQVQSSFAPPALTAQQKIQFSEMASKSGLGVQGQKFASFMIGAFDTATKNAASNVNPFTMLAFGTVGTNGPIRPDTFFSFNMARVSEIPIGRMAVEAQKS